MMEAQSGPILSTIMAMQEAVNSDNPTGLTTHLDHLASLISELENILERMYENCLPGPFYKRIRRYLAGWTNDPSLPSGLFYGNNSESGEFYSGASAAQSPMIQAIDIALGVDHLAMKERKEEKEAAVESRVGLPGAYLYEMRQYMLKSHRECLQYLQETLTIRSHITKSSSHQVHAAYNNCLQSLESFRSAHIRMVSYYIVAQAAREQLPIQGTGGSNPIPFLKDIRHHLSAHKIPE